MHLWMSFTVTKGGWKLKHAHASPYSQTATEAVLWNNGFLKNFSKFKAKHLCQSLKLQALGFSCEFCEIFKNTFFTEHLRAIASTYWYVWLNVSYWVQLDGCITILDSETAETVIQWK